MVEQFFIAFSAALVAVALALTLIWTVGRRRGPDLGNAVLDRDLESIVFLFRNKVLVDATGPARALLSVVAGDDDWMRLTSWLSMRMPDSAAALADLGKLPRLELTDGTADHPCAFWPRIWGTGRCA